MKWLVPVFLVILQAFSGHSCLSQRVAKLMPLTPEGNLRQQNDLDGAAIPVNVLTLRHPSFGSFHVGPRGGRIVVHADGQRTAEGDVILLNSGSTVGPLIFEVRCTPFSFLHLVLDDAVVLVGEDGSTLRARILETQPPLPSVAPAGADGGFVVSASISLTIPPGQMLSAGGYTGTFVSSWLVE